MLTALALVACTSGNIGSGEPEPEDEQEDTSPADTGLPGDSDPPDTGEPEDTAPPVDTGPDAWRIYSIWAFAGASGTPGTTQGTLPFELDSEDFPIRLWVSDHEGNRVGDDEGPFYEGESDTITVDSGDDPELEAFLANLTDGTKSTLTVGLTNVAGTVELTEEVPTDRDYAGHTIDMVTLNLSMQADMSGP